MSKSGVEEKKKKDEEGVTDNKPPPGPTRLTRNRLLLHQLQQQQQQNPSTDGKGDPVKKVDDPKSGSTDSVKTKSKPKEDGGSKDRPSSSPSLDNEKETRIQQPDKKTKPEDSVPTMKPRPKRGEKNKKTKTPAGSAKDKESKDENVTPKNVLPVKTRTTRSCNQPAANNVAATKQQKKEGDENAKNLKKKKVISSSYNRRSKKRMYDDTGALLANGKDYCDCLEMDCPGCHFPCKKCGSEKCGTECRCDRTWVYDEVKVEGTGIIIKNHAC